MHEDINRISSNFYGFYFFSRANHTKLKTTIDNDDGGNDDGKDDGTEAKKFRFGCNGTRHVVDIVITGNFSQQ